MKKARERRLILDSVMLGVVGALAAQAFTILLHLAEHLLAAGRQDELYYLGNL